MPSVVTNWCLVTCPFSGYLHAHDDRRQEDAPRVAASLAGRSGRRLPLRRARRGGAAAGDRKSTRLNSSHLVISYAVFLFRKKKSLNSSHLVISYAVFCLKKKKSLNFSHILKLQFYTFVARTTTQLNDTIIKCAI